MTTTLEGFKGNGAKLLEIAQIAVDSSGGRLRLVESQEEDALHHHLEFDGKFLGREIELYAFLGDSFIGVTPRGWPKVLAEFLGEVVRPLRSELPESYEKAAKALKELGETVYPEHLLEQWRQLF